MAGYSGKSVVQKLGIKPGFRIFVDGAPDCYTEVVGEFPADVALAPRLTGSLDMVHMFTTRAAALRKRLPTCAAAIAPGGMVWVWWPKKSSGIATDVTENVVRDTAISLGLVDIKVCAVDDIWSGLKLVIPLDQRKVAARPSTLKKS